MIKTPPGKEFIPFQVEGLLKLISRKHNLLADEMGLGKTVQAIGLINTLELPKVLIICKASIKQHWLNKIMEWSTEFHGVQIVDKKTELIRSHFNIVIINYDLIIHSYIHQQLKNRKWDLLICDEAHALKNLQSKRTHAVLSTDGLVRQATRTLMMTGTPILNRPVELYGMLKVLAPQVIEPYSTYTKFTKRYCAAYQDGFCWNVQGASHIDELNKKLREHYMIRRLTHEVEVQLPKKRYEIVFLDPTKDIQTKLRVLDTAGRKDFKYQNLEKDGGQLAVLRRETAEEKIKIGEDLIKEYCESSGKIIIFVYHRSVLMELSRKLGEFNPVVLHGGCSSNQRDEAITRFQKDPSCQVFIGQIQAAGEGIDGLQDVCNNCLFVEWSWVPGEIEQACKRLHRIGQKKPVLYRFLVWANSIEEHMMRVALDKVKTIKEVLK